LQITSLGGGFRNESSHWSGCFKRWKSSSDILDKGKPYRKSIKVSPTIEDLDLLVEFLEVVKRETGKKPPIVLESTGHYHSSVVHRKKDRCNDYSEIEEIDRFTDPKMLVAFAGVDPSVFEWGKFTATKNRITNRGSSRLRHALYMAVCCAIHDCRKSKTSDEIIPRNKKLREFYDKKRQEGKPFRSGSIKQNVDTHPSPFQHLN
jgi:hypothetical protein